MNNEHLGGVECRSPLHSRAYSMARHRRAGARAGAVSAPACGGWLRPPVLAGPLAAARPHFGASAAAPSVGRMGGPLRGFAVARPRPAPPVGSGLGLALAAARCAPRPALLPRGGSCAWRFPPRRPSLPLSWVWRSAALRRAGASLRLPGGVFRRCSGGWRGLRRAGIQSEWLCHSPWLRQGGIHAIRAPGPLAYPHAPHSLSASAYSIVTSGLSCCNAFCTFARS